jgi:N-acetyl-anhydromuramyl-L-alanine amidase AmpD
MLLIDKNGLVVNCRIKQARRVMIERGALAKVASIIIHQSGASSPVSTLNSYQHRHANGAHFLIDTDGSIFQTASIHRQTWHVGKLKSRCLITHTCSLSDQAALKKFRPTAENKREATKEIPDRFPNNQDSLGIELVGGLMSDGQYAVVTAEQNTALKWLVTELTTTLRISAREVFRHPDVSRKNPTEASTAQWQ